MNDIDLLAKLRDVPPPSDETMREVAVLFAAETDLIPAPPKRSGPRRLAIAGGSVAAAAAVIGVVSLISSMTTPAQPQAAGNGRDVILAAYDANADSIMHVVRTEQTADHPVNRTDDWYSSSDAKPGQSLVHRSIMLEWSQGDIEYVSKGVVPTAGSTSEGCTMAPEPNDPYDHKLSVAGEVLGVNYQAKVFSRNDHDCLLSSDLGPQGLRDQIASGQWRQVPGETTVDGQRAIEYTKVPTGNPIGVLDQQTRLWVNADTNLLIRMDQTTVQAGIQGVSDGKPITQHDTDDYTFLPNTPENRKNLEVSVPSGFKQVPNLFDTGQPIGH